MSTENTISNDETDARGWIFYDARCAPCLWGRERAGRLWESRGFRWVPLQTPGAALRLGVSETAFVTRMHLLTADGKVRHNADAFALLCRSVWWLWPLGALLLVPGFRESGRLAYDWFARNRYCFGGTCRRPTKRQPGWEGWLPLLLLPLLAISFHHALAPWVFMLIVVFVISGLIHELVITLPAGGGFGLPTLYFGLHIVFALLPPIYVWAAWKGGNL